MKKIFLLFLFLSGRLGAQPATGITFMVTVNDGLSQGMVFDILQSRDGFIWIATKDGLNRYDGYHCKIFSPDPFNPFSIGAGEIRNIFQDSHGRIWICHPKGLDVFIPAINQFFHLPKEHMPGLSGGADYERYSSFAETPDGAIWIVNSAALWKIEDPTIPLDAAAQSGNAYPEFRFTGIAPPLYAEGATGVRAKFISVFYSKGNVLLAGTSRGLYRLDPATGKLTLAALPGTPVKITGEDKAGKIWLQMAAEEEQLNKSREGYMAHPFRLWQSCTWNGHSVSSLPVMARRVDMLRLDQDGYLWILLGNTLRKWQPEALAGGGRPEFEWTCTEPFTQVTDFYYPSLAVDRSGIAWLGTNGYGVLKVNPVKPKFTSYLPVSSQRYLKEDPEGRLWTYSAKSILYTSKKFDRNIPNPWFFVTANDDPASATVFDAAGNGWGNNEDDYLYRIDAHSKTRRAFPWKGKGLLYSRQGKLFSAAEEGLLQFDPLTEQSRLFAFDRPQKFLSAYDYVHYLFEDQDGAFWLFAFEGLVRATPDPAGYRFDYYKNNPSDPSSLFHNFVLSVADDPLEPSRYLWVGTKVGLDRMDKQAGTFKHFNTSQGLPDNVIYGILSDNKGHIWLSTNKGLCRFHVRDETVKNFTLADGLQSNEFNQSSYLKTRDGALIFGGVNGFTVFYPDSLRFNEHVPQTQIVGLRVNNEPFDINRLAGQSLAHTQNFLTLEFAALEFSNPAQNHYRYQLIRHGIFNQAESEQEIDLGEKNVVQFANLQPGRYTFKVLGSNNDGVWSLEPAVLEFVIRPPWWASGWAYLMYIALVGTGAWFFYRYQLRRRMETQETLRLRELDDFKNRFFTNITHEFRTPLTVILGMSERLLSDGVTQSHPVTIAQPLSLIKRSGENLLRLINQLLDLAKLESKSLKINYEQGDVLAYLRYIAESLHSLANAQNVMLRVESSEAAIVMDYDPERLLQIVYNLLSNAIKFTPSGGRVVLRAGLLNLEGLVNLELTVTDNGAGIPAEDLPYIFDRFYQANNLEKAKAGGTGIGLALTRELVEMMQGSIAVQSTPGKGTEFTVLLPVTNRSEKRAVRSEINGIAESEKGVKHKAAHATDAHPLTSHLSLLIIEDNPDVVEYLAACLEQGDHEGRPYTLDFAYNGRAGIEKALENIPDLIISDVMMPEKDGFEVCDALKNNERTSHIPFILLTAKADVESRLAGLRRGADAYLTKPFHSEELLLTLHNLLELRRKMQATFRNRSIEPTEEPDTPVHDSWVAAIRIEDVFLKKVIVQIEKHLDDADFGVPQLSRTMGMSQSQLYRKIKALTDLSTVAFIRNIRLLEGKRLLETTDLTISEVAYEVGFTTLSYFSDAFLETFGVRPNVMRN